MPADAVPERIRWAVRTLAVAPTDRVLEIGCGGGVAVAVICPLLSTGSMTAIDRSAAMTARAQRRNAAHIAAGRATIRTAAFPPADLAAAGLEGVRFDKVFAVNLNVFWTSPARAELVLIRELLATDGVLQLCYELPAGRRDDISGRVVDTLAGTGFAAQVTRSEPLVGITGRPVEA